MPELLPTIERNIRRLSAKTAKILEILAGSHALSGPVLYQRVMRDIRDVQRMWENHRTELSEIVRSVPQDAPDSAPSLRRLDRNTAAIASQLEALSSAAWPRHPEIGVRSLGVRGQKVLTAILQQLESEKAVLVPLLNRSASPRNPAHLSMVSGEPVATEAREI